MNKKLKNKEKEKHEDEDEDDLKLDEDLFYLQRQINVIINDRKKIQNETRILNQRVVLLNKQMTDLDMKYNNTIMTIEKRLENNKKIREGEKMKLDMKFKQQKELEDKRKKIFNQKDDKRKQRISFNSSINNNMI